MSEGKREKLVRAGSPEPAGVGTLGIFPRGRRSPGSITNSSLVDGRCFCRCRGCLVDSVELRQNGQPRTYLLLLPFAVTAWL